MATKWQVYVEKHLFSKPELYSEHQWWIGAYILAWILTDIYPYSRATIRPGKEQ